jgi:hypothetical protein
VGKESSFPIIGHTATFGRSDSDLINQIGTCASMFVKISFLSCLGLIACSFACRSLKHFQIKYNGEHKVFQLIALSRSGLKLHQHFVAAGQTPPLLYSGDDIEVCCSLSLQPHSLFSLTLV